MGNQTLRKIVIRHSLIVLLLSLLVPISMFILFNLLINMRIVYPANYPEKQIEKIEQKIQTDEDLLISEIPNFYQYEILTSSNEKVYSTIPKKEQKYVQLAMKSGKSQSSEWFRKKYFVYLKGEKGNLVLSYQLMGDFMSEKVRRYLPNAEISFYVAIFFVWVISFILVVRLYSTKLQNELKKVNNIIKNIKSEKLDFEVPNSSIKEINEVISTLDKLKMELSTSLERQWDIDQKLYRTLQAVSHDIRTPITLIGGNLDLLKETELSTKQEDLIRNSYKGVSRLNTYVEELKYLSGISKHTTVEKVQITKEVVSEWISLAKELSDIKGIHLVTEKMETSIVFIDLPNITKAFQNVVQNAIKFSSEDGTVSVSFFNSNCSYNIVIKDDGRGFSEEALKRATERFYTTSLDRGGKNYGLGLSIAESIIREHKGIIEIKNIKSKDKIIGANVTLSIPFS